MFLVCVSCGSFLGVSVWFCFVFCFCWFFFFKETSMFVMHNLPREAPFKHPDSVSFPPCPSRPVLDPDCFVSRPPFPSTRTLLLTLVLMELVMVEMLCRVRGSRSPLVKSLPKEAVMSKYLPSCLPRCLAAFLLIPLTLRELPFLVRYGYGTHTTSGFLSHRHGL